jgi:AcrR family transcriptional regulator
VTTPGDVSEEREAATGDQSAGSADRRRKRERLLRGRTLAERRQERRDALLAAALELFGTQGYAATPIEEICRHAYVSTRNFYEEFPNRRAVLTALALRIGEDIIHAFLDVEVEPGPDEAVRQVTAAMAAVVHVVVDDPRVARVAFVETMGDDTLRRLVLSTFPQGLRAHLRETFEERGLDPARQQAFTVALCGAVSELLADWVLHPDDQPPVDVLVTHVVELTTAVLRLPPAGPATAPTAVVPP